LLKGDCKRLTGCTNNVLNNQTIECKACEADYHLINKKCQKKVVEAGCDGKANVEWKNGVDYCNKCKSTHYTFEGKCYLRTTMVGCETGKQAYNAKLKEHCTVCKTGYLLGEGKCFKLLTGCETKFNVVKNGTIECAKCLIEYHLISKKCQKKILPPACDGLANVFFTNGAEYCNKCKVTHYTFGGKCFIKSAIAGCDGLIS